jgi:hypothetical protein
MPTGPVVPGRNDVPEGMEIHARSRAGELSGHDPGYQYQWASKDPRSPQYVERYLRDREIGSPVAGYYTAPAWELAKPGQVKQGGGKRADDGNPVDTTLTHGDLVCIRTTRKNWEREQHMKDRVVEAQAAGLASNDRKQMDQTRYGVQVYTGDATSGAHAKSVVSSELTGGK